MVELREVFGVSKHPILSYIERPAVDEALKKALADTDQIVIYGSSKQGKTALLERHLDAANRTTVHCGPKMSVEDLYRSILRQRGVEIKTGAAKIMGSAAEVSTMAKFIAILPFIGGGEAEIGATITESEEETLERRSIEFNLSVAQDVGELISSLKCDGHFHVLENFHYLSDDVQNQLAFDFRTFEEMGIRFVILGVWRERNRLIQYNGDLQERVSEIPVEPWTVEDFSKVVELGSKHLGISISQRIKDRIFDQAHGSIAVVQELVRKVCEIEGIIGDTGQVRVIDSEISLDEAVHRKVEDFTARHVRSLESISAGSRTRRATEGTAALYLPYYFVKVMVERKYSELNDGIERKALQELIQATHPAPQNVRGSDVTGMLTRLAALQAKSKIVPPLFDYDRGSRRVKVVDSTLYFFIDNCIPEDVMAEIAHPDSLSDDLDD